MLLGQRLNAATGLRPATRRMQAMPLRARPVMLRLRAVESEEKASVAEQQQQAAAAGSSKSVSDLAKDALQELNADTMTTASVLGEANFARLKQALGEEKLAQITGVLDPVLKNRRLITLVSALVDVALIIAGIKAFQSFTAQ